MENTTPNDTGTKTPNSGTDNPLTNLANLTNVGTANFLRGMANDQKNHNHALAMGQSQMRQMMGENWKDPAPESEEMKIAAHGITETTNHYHFHGGQETGQAGGAVAPSAPSSSPPPADVPPLPPPAPSAGGGLVRKMAPLVLAATLGSSGVLIGQALNRVWPPPSPQVSSPQESIPAPSPSPPVSPPPEHPPTGAIIINPERPDLIWELDLGKPKGTE